MGSLNQVEVGSEPSIVWHKLLQLRLTEPTDELHETKVSASRAQ